MYRIKQISFTHPIAATDTHHTFVEIELLMEVIFELE
jgi:hypothetical protein